MVVSVILPKSSSCSSSSTSTSTETLSAGRGFFLSLSSSPLPSPPSSLPSPPVRVGGTSIPLSPWLSFSPPPWLSFSLWPWLFPLLSPFSSASSDPKIFFLYLLWFYSNRSCNQNQTLPPCFLNTLLRRDFLPVDFCFLILLPLFLCLLIPSQILSHVCLVTLQTSRALSFGIGIKSVCVGLVRCVLCCVLLYVLLDDCMLKELGLVWSSLLKLP